MANVKQESAAELRAHQQWIGFVQPVGLVASLPALEKAQCYVNRSVAREQQTLVALAPAALLPGAAEPAPVVSDLRALFRDLLGWQETDLVEPPESFEIALVHQGDHLRPTFAVPSAEGDGTFQALVMALYPGTDLDARRSDTGWASTPQERIERLLQETGVPLGILFNGVALRLVYAPRCEAVGHVTFPVQAMTEPAGRPILGALLMLLGVDRVFNLPPTQRLLAILRDSRRYQSEVSNRLADQVLGALHELLRGFQAADQAARGQVLGPVLRDDPAQVYGGLLTTLLRLVFLLYAEDWSLVSDDALYVRNYSVTGLFEKLREDASRFVDTMDQRHGAWSRLLTLFRMIFAGGTHGALALPARLGKLFDPDAFPFLEGRAGQSGTWQRGQRLAVPRVSDGCLFRVLEKLLILDGDRLSYRALEVEQIGSVYEAIMGFTVEQTGGPAVALRPHHVVVDLAALLRKSGPDRLKELADEARCKVTGKAQEAVRSAKTIDELVAALGRHLSPRTPEALPVGTLVLQPTEERRRSGSHYTPRSLTEPIVERTLGPVLAALSDDPRGPTPDQILSLKVCDPAMGSGAFLVAACDYLSRRLVAAWQAHGAPPSVAAVADRLQLARSLVAQRCLYGVDKNPLAVNLAKLSLWLFTLAKDQPFTFLDHSLRHGDSLVGLSREQIASFHWAPEKQLPTVRFQLDRALADAVSSRLEIHALATSSDNQRKGELLRQADEAIARMKHLGNLVIEAYLAHDKDKDRKDARKRWEVLASSDKTTLPETPEAGKQAAFHWFLEFPEVFARENPGFDCFVGNPPFAGKNTITSANGDNYIEWLKVLHEGAHGNADLVAHFFRRTFVLLRTGGTVGLIATNTVAQGDTRTTGLRWVCDNGGFIYGATRRLKWPGLAAVVVSVVHVAKGDVVQVFPGLERGPRPPAPSPRGEGEEKGKGKGKEMQGEGSPRGRVSLSEVEAAFEMAQLAGRLRQVPDELLERARKLRGRQTPAEEILWECLRGRKLHDAKFRRQHNIDRFIVDFYCHEARLVIEVDGSVHAGREDVDAERQRMLENFGLKVLRFSNEQIFEDLRFVLERIAAEALTPNPSPGGEGSLNPPEASEPLSSPPPLPGERGLGGEGPFLLDGHPVPRITAYLFDKGTSADPLPLKENENKSFQGSIVLGMGFTFDDSNPDATPLAEMHRLIAKDSRNAERIFSYLGGEELNSSPTQRHHRYVINFGQMSEDEARQWPDLMAIVEKKVRGKRGKHSTAPWWQFERLRGELYEAIRPLERVLAIARVGQQAAFSFLTTDHIFSEQLVAFSIDGSTGLALLQCRVHEIWARFFASSLEDRLRYTPSDCFETFPFPRGWQDDAVLEAAGKEYHDFRAKLMADEAVRGKQMEGLPPEGLTATYNRFHDPDCTLPGIVELRRLHEEMDRAVLAAYGWSDVPTRCEFLLDYEEDEEDEEGAQARKKKKPWRFRWPDEVRDDVLARLLALNAERAAEEKLLGEQAALAAVKPAKKPARKKAAPEPQPQPQLQPEPEPKPQMKLFGEETPATSAGRKAPR
jgi:very-short-patch-repair endonuclease